MSQGLLDNIIIAFPDLFRNQLEIENIKYELLKNRLG